MAVHLLATLCLLVVAASALPPGLFPRAMRLPTTQTPYTKPTCIPEIMPESCKDRPVENDYLMIVSPITCAKFIVCHGGLEWEMDCPAGLWFNYVKQYCDWPGQSCCDESKRPGTTTTPMNNDTATPPLEDEPTTTTTEEPCQCKNPEKCTTCKNKYRR